MGLISYWIWFTPQCKEPQRIKQASCVHLQNPLSQACRGPKYLVDSAAPLVTVYSQACYLGPPVQVQSILLRSFQTYQIIQQPKPAMTGFPVLRPHRSFICEEREEVRDIDLKLSLRLQG